MVHTTRYLDNIVRVMKYYRNGSRLSGLFVVAMNLFLRARIEQEVDIVLEVKLARRSRPEFVSDYVSNRDMYLRVYSVRKHVFVCTLNVVTCICVYTQGGNMYLCVYSGW